MYGDPNAPNKPEEWLRFARCGDNLTVWTHSFYPQLQSFVVYDGPLSEFNFAAVSGKMDSFVVPPPKRPEAEALETVQRMIAKASGAGADLTDLLGLRKFVEGVVNTSVPPGPQSSVGPHGVQGPPGEGPQCSTGPKGAQGYQPPSGEWQNIAGRLRRGLLSIDIDELNRATRAMSDYVNALIREAQPHTAAMHGELVLRVPITDMMVPAEGDDADPRDRILKELYDLFYKIWDSK